MSSFVKNIQVDFEEYDSFLEIFCQPAKWLKIYFQLWFMLAISPIEFPQVLWATNLKKHDIQILSMQQNLLWITCTWLFWDGYTARYQGHMGNIVGVLNTLEWTKPVVCDIKIRQS